MPGRYDNKSVHIACFISGVTKHSQQMNCLEWPRLYFLKGTHLVLGALVPWIWTSMHVKGWTSNNYCQIVPLSLLDHSAVNLSFNCLFRLLALLDPFRLVWISCRGKLWETMSALPKGTHGGILSFQHEPRPDQYRIAIPGHFSPSISQDLSVLLRTWAMNDHSWHASSIKTARIPKVTSKP